MFGVGHVARQPPHFLDSYTCVAAELSSEEITSVTEILENNYRRASPSQLLDLLVADNPLCLQSDLEELLDEFIKSKQKVPAPQEPQLTLSNPTRNTPSTTNPRHSNHEAPAAFLDSKWTLAETERLEAYLIKTKGRKNWLVCAQQVGSKSSSQCKAKYNNLRANHAHQQTGSGGQGHVQQVQGWW